MKSSFLWLAATLLVLPCVAHAKERAARAAEAAQPLHVLGLKDAFPAEVLDLFAKETGIPVEAEKAGTGVEILSSFLAGEGASYFDVVELGSYGIQELIAANLLRPLDNKLIPNIRHLDPAFTDLPYDPGSRFSIPYQVVWTGLVVNPDLAKQEVAHYADIFQPEWKNRIVVRNGVRGLYRWAALSMGTPDQQVTKEGIKALQPLLEKWVGVLGPAMLEGRLEDLESGKAVAGAMLSGEAATALAKNPRLRWVFPDEENRFFLHLLAVPGGTAKYEQACQLINFLLRPDIAKLVAEKYRYMTPNLSARKKLSKEFLGNPASYLPEKVFSRLKPTISYSDLTDPLMGKSFMEIQTKVFFRPGAEGTPERKP
ncbi:MAG: spermidine/putrescine ABC transporter substrate-binding protein [Verrucomicrobiae bacterium]